MNSRFFAKTDKRPLKPFFRNTEKSSSDDTANSGQTDFAGSGVLNPLDSGNAVTHRRLQLLAPKLSLAEKLERLLLNANMAFGQLRNEYLLRMLILIKSNPSLVNYTPKLSDKNPLELTLTLGNITIAKELIALRGEVRSKNQYLFDMFADQLQPQQAKNMRLNPNIRHRFSPF